MPTWHATEQSLGNRTLNATLQLLRIEQIKFRSWDHLVAFDGRLPKKKALQQPEIIYGI
jgi:hypothetical protein